MLGYDTQSNMFKGSNKSFYQDPVGAKEKMSIFGFDEFKNKYLRSSACCVIQGGGQLPSGGQEMNSFYPTIWEFNKRNVLTSVMSFGDNCCEPDPVL